MQRLLLILVTLIFGVTQAAAAPSAMCRHVSIEAHSQALESSDFATSGEAHHEEAAASAANKMASDNVTASLGLGVLPDQRHLVELPRQGALPWATAPPGHLSGRAIAPLLDPPLA